MVDSPAQTDGEKVHKLLLLLPKYLVDAIDKDADRCGRARIRHIEAILNAYFGLKNVDIGDLGEVRRFMALLGANVAVTIPQDTNAPSARMFEEVAGDGPSDRAGEAQSTAETLPVTIKSKPVIALIRRLVEERNETASVITERLLSLAEDKLKHGGKLPIKHKGGTA